jgi:hypothetical protein
MEELGFWQHCFADSGPLVFDIAWWMSNSGCFEGMEDLQLQGSNCLGLENGTEILRIVQKH